MRSEIGERAFAGTSASVIVLIVDELSTAILCLFFVVPVFRCLFVCNARGRATAKKHFTRVSSVRADPCR